MDASFGFGQFGQSPIFGLPSTDMQMNIYYAQQARAHAERNPHDVQAQRQMFYWLEVTQRQQQGQPVAGPALQTMGPSIPMSAGVPAQGAYAGASAPAAAAAPPPPPSFAASAETASGSGVHYGSSERGRLVGAQTPSCVTPNHSRPAIPSEGTPKA